MLTRATLALSATLLLACGSKEEAPAPAGPPPRSLVGHPKNGELPADLVCPGAATCAPSDDGTLYAAVASEVITAPITEKVTKSVRNKPWEFNGLAGDTFDDVNGNGKFDGTWIAGFGTGRAAAGVADEQFVRVVILKQGNTKIAMISIDCVGWMYDEVLRIREQLSAEKVDVSYVFAAATHVHEARDTMGIWGIDDATSGLDKAFNKSVRDKAVKAVKDALARLEPANVTFGTIDVDGHLPETDPLKRGVKAFVSDGRDPVVIDLAMNTMRLTRAGGDKGTIATVVNFASHPEFGGDRNVLLSSDYVHTLREGIEKGVDVGPMKKAGLGGTAVFFQGACGGQIGPGDVEVADANGVPFPEDDDMFPTIGLARAKTMGTNYAYYALTSLDAGKGAMSYETVRIGVRARQIFGAIENRAYHVAIASRLFDRKGHHFDEALPIGPSNQPDLLTEIAVLDIGPAQMLSVPGEIHPELVIGMGPETTPAPYLRVQPENKNPPDLSKAPTSGHLDQFVDKTAKFRWVLGLGNDEMGYLVPAWNYEVHADDPYYDEPPGDHYEETNSIGPKVEAEVIEPLRDLLKNTKTPIVRP